MYSKPFGRAIEAFSPFHITKGGAIEMAPSPDFFPNWQKLPEWTGTRETPGLLWAADRPPTTTPARF
jgi:hypothetical protein